MTLLHIQRDRRCKGGHYWRHGDVDRDVEKELGEFAGDFTDKPVVGCVMIRHERHANDNEDDVSDCQIQQQAGKPTTKAKTNWTFELMYMLLRKFAV